MKALGRSARQLLTLNKCVHHHHHHHHGHTLSILSTQCRYNQCHQRHMNNNSHANSHTNTNKKKIIKACALDIDGVLIKGNQPIPGAIESLIKLKQYNIPFVCLTNGGGMSEELKTMKLNQILNKYYYNNHNHHNTHIITPDQMILSHTPMQHLASLYANDHVLIIGGGDCDELMRVVKSYGFNHAIHISHYVQMNPILYPTFPPPPPLSPSNHQQLEQQQIEQQQLEQQQQHVLTNHDFKAILVMYDSDHVGRDAQVLIDVMRSKGTPGRELYHHSNSNHHHHHHHHVQLYMSHEDFLYSSNFVWPRFGQGFFKMTVQHIFKQLTGHDLRVNMYGKPHVSTYRYAEKVLHSQVLSRTSRISDENRDSSSVDDGDDDDIEWIIYGVGDNPFSDIAGANGAGEHWRSVLTRTGVFSSDDPSLLNHDIHPADYVVQDISQFVDDLIHDRLA